MEVSLLDVKGLPPGCIISVRSGTTRCQALADPDKMRLVFPKGAKDPFKVDLLAPLGSAELKFQSGANAYPIQIPVNGAIGSITLGVREVAKPSKLDLNAIASMDYTKDDKGRPATPATASRRHRLALEARTYLEDNKLLSFVQSLLQGLIRDKPEDPWEYINECSVSAKKIGVPEPYKPGMTPRDQNAVVPPPFAPLARSVDGQGREEALLLATASVDAARQGEDDGASAVVTRPTSAHPTLVSEAGEFNSKLDMGTVQKALDSVGRQQQCAWNQKPSCGTWVAIKPKVDQAAALAITRKNVLNALIKATGNGKLEQVLREEVNKPLTYVELEDLKGKALKELEKAPAAAADLRELRGKAQNALLEACRSGKLAAALGVQAAQQKSAELKMLRSSLKLVLVKAAKNGDIEKVMKAEVAKAAAPKPFHQRASAPANVRSIRIPPSWATPMAQVEAAELKKVRGQARGVLLKAGQNGSLAQALQDVTAEQTAVLDEAAQMKKTAQELLMQASSDPRFLQAMQEAALAAGFEFVLKPKTPAAAAGSSTQSGDDLNVDRLRDTARARIVQASQDGSFLQALDEASGDLEGMKAQARQKLLQARGDGSFQKALMEVQQPAGGDLDEIRQRVRGKMEAALVEGKLESTLGTVVKGGVELLAPSYDAKRGDEVQYRRDPSKRGGVLQRTTTDVLLRMNDGTEAWEDVDDLQQVLSGGCDIVPGDEVIGARQGKRGKTMKRTTTEVLILNDDGSEEWLGVGDVGKAKSRPDLVDSATEDLFDAVNFNKSGMLSPDEFFKAMNDGLIVDGRDDGEEQRAKANARDALMAALLGDQSDAGDVEVAKEAAREALMAALSGGRGSQVEEAKRQARDALMAALVGSKKAAPQPTQQVSILPFGNYYASNKIANGAATTKAFNSVYALFGNKPKEPRSEPPAEAQKKDEPPAPQLQKTTVASQVQAAAPTQPPQQLSMSPFGPYYASNNFACGGSVFDSVYALFGKPPSAKAQDQSSITAAPQVKKEAPNVQKSEATIPTSSSASPVAKKEETAPAKAKSPAPRAKASPGKAKSPGPSSSSASASPLVVRSASPARSPALITASFAELEDKVRTRNDRFRTENEALRVENRRLKDLWDKQVETEKKSGPEAS